MCTYARARVHDDVHRRVKNEKDPQPGASKVEDSECVVHGLYRAGLRLGLGLGRAELGLGLGWAGHGLGLGWVGPEAPFIL